MRELYIVAITNDGAQLVLAASPDAVKGSHVLPVDARLQAALRGTLPAPGSTSAAESALSPKEIQARLRAGETPEQVAKIAGVPVARVLRYAGPVMSERARMVDEARDAVMTKARAGASAVPVGAAADLHLAETPGLKADTVDWTARRRDDGTWIVRLTYVARGRARAAEWGWDPAQRVVTALDSYAGKLGYVAPGRPTVAAPASKRGRRTAAASTPRTTKTTGRTPKGSAAKHSTAKSTAAKSTAAKSSAAKSTAAKRSAAKGTAVRSGGRPATATAATATAATATAAKATAAKASAPPARGRSAAKRSSTTPMPRDQGVRDVGEGKRAAVPTWSDVLLGTRPPAPAKRNGSGVSTGTSGKSARRSTGARRSARG
ncbi:MAG TPA: septation protein SepH [Mycobacteriales bacterium]|nr:septation protein SepH [Mycobacteriales bacterium]